MLTRFDSLLAGHCVRSRFRSNLDSISPEPMCGDAAAYIHYRSPNRKT